ncbi:hypothetical protein PSQ19_15765 [Devosia algicola]|uniref:ABC1 atypical kinase-like domain-containing protein n=1 Tax=Devosia algicola TaxID=3026418 RepID=A0ABY7YM32_9HYPH|nr:hypothetical protein [Devosia algicola]WDR02109.1 hypothetical protein PSQ19_15765 [Devosia algicola]
MSLPPGLRFGVATARLIERRAVRRTGRVERLTRALNRLGPTYVKFGQTLATRPDIVGADIAEDLSTLQDRMDPFDSALVPAILNEALGVKAARLTEPFRADCRRLDRPGSSGPIDKFCRANPQGGGKIAATGRRAPLHGRYRKLLCGRASG